MIIGTKSPSHVEDGKCDSVDGNPVAETPTPSFCWQERVHAASQMDIYKTHEICGLYEFPLPIVSLYWGDIKLIQPGSCRIWRVPTLFSAVLCCTWLRSSAPYKLNHKKRTCYSRGRNRWLFPRYCWSLCPWNNPSSRLGILQVESVPRPSRFMIKFRIRAWFRPLVMNLLSVTALVVGCQILWITSSYPDSSLIF